MTPPSAVQPGTRPARPLVDVSDGGRRCTFIGDSGCVTVLAEQAIPRSASLFYFEMTVLSAGEEGKLAIGLAPERIKHSLAPGCASCCYDWHGLVGPARATACSSARMCKTPDERHRQRQRAVCDTAPPAQSRFGRPCPCDVAEHAGLCGTAMATTVRTVASTAEPTTCRCCRTAGTRLATSWARACTTRIASASCFSRASSSFVAHAYQLACSGISVMDRPRACLSCATLTPRPHWAQSGCSGIVTARECSAENWPTFGNKSVQVLLAASDACTCMSLARTGCRVR